MAEHALERGSFSRRVLDASDFVLRCERRLLSGLMGLLIVLVLLNVDVSALMGYTGATYKAFFGSSTGLLYTLGIMLIWVVVPILLALRSFRKKDL